MHYLVNGLIDKGIKPAAADAGHTHKVMMFNVLNHQLELIKKFKYSSNLIEK